MRMASPLLALREGYSEAAVGFLLALYALTQVFLALPAGRYADRHGLRRPMAFSCIAAGVAGALAFAFPVFPVLCVSALLTGGAAGSAAIALQRHVGRAASTPVQRKQAFSWLAIGPACSNFVGPFAAGVLIDHAGFRAAFFMIALLPLATWAFVHRASELPASEPTGAGRPGRAWDLWREPMFRRLMLVNWFLSSAWDVHTFVVPVLGHERGLSASVIGTILGGFAVATAAVRVVLPMLAARVHEWALIVAAMVATALIYFVYPLMHAALAMGVAALLLVPVGIFGAGTVLLDGHFLLLGAGVALLSSVLPYSLELEALRRLPSRVFGVLMSLEPGIAALVGIVLLHEQLELRAAIAIVLVTAASVGAARF
ncbi:MFS transporter, partial [Ramlibacter sp.]|uniref:MFS transporter n=1 Tax=Ramlibacter sp. TaxID=1917967 RepID=UPI0039C8D27E